MAIKFQYNKTSLQQLEKQLKVRVRTLPIIKNKESALRMEVKRCKVLEHARKKTTQKVNLFEKVQIPGYQDALRKIKRFMEDEENLSKSSQKIMKSHQEKRKEAEA